MTEPNVLGNGGVAGGAKFIWENGNTEVINLWSADDFGGTKSMHYPSSATLNGADYEVPSSRVFYMLNLHKSWGSNTDVAIMKNTTTDSATGATTLWRIYEAQVGENFQLGYLKFVAGEFVIQNVTGGNDQFWTAWGVEVDA